MISEDGLKLIKKWEGLRLEAYIDAGGTWTIGYGHTGNVKKGQKITMDDAEDLLKQDVKKANECVCSYDHVYHWTQNEEDALTSFTYNLGSANMHKLTANCRRTKQEIAEKMVLYVNCNGKKLPGLVHRRNDERSLFLTPVADWISPEHKADIKEACGYLRQALECLERIC